MGETYESAGASIEAGEEAVERIKADVRSTFRPEVIGDIGGHEVVVHVDDGQVLSDVVEQPPRGGGVEEDIVVQESVRLHQLVSAWSRSSDGHALEATVDHEVRPVDVGAALAG